MIAALQAAHDRTLAGWHGTVTAFLALAEAPFIDALSAHLRRCMGLGPDGLQLTAWRNEFAVLKMALSAAADREAHRLTTSRSAHPWKESISEPS
ncbi:MAG: hypothetical protein ACYC33_06335 [Thermoleophilia bacterium]